MYDKNNNYVDLFYNDNMLIGSGYYGNVYRINNDNCLKILKEDLMLCIEPKVLEVIASNYYPNLCKIHSVYHDFQGYLYGYLMDYINKDYLSILENKDYLLDSLNNLYYSMFLLTKQSIKVEDLKPYNIIRNKNGIYLIDFDLYEFSNKDYYELLEYNINSLKDLIKNIVKIDLEKRMVFFKENIDLNKFNYLFNNDYSSIMNILNNYDKPISYFKSKN